MNKIKQWLFYENKYAAIEHTVRDSVALINILGVSKKKKELIITNRNQYTSIEDIIANTHQKHSFLIVNNQQVLYKKIDIVNDNKLHILRNTFPNIVLDDFYYEIYATEKATFVVICRKKYIDTLIEKYTKIGISIIGFSLGNLSIQQLLPFLAQDVYTSNALVKIEKNNIDEIKKNNTQLEEYTVNDLKITNDETLTLGGVLNIFFNRSVFQKGLEEKNTSLLNDFISKKTIIIGLKTGLASLFLILLINFLLFSNYHSKTNELKTYIQLNSTQKQELLALKKETNQKEKIVSSLETASQSNASKYLDKIAQLIPNTILLNEVKYQPIKTQIKKKKPIFIIENTIVIKGISKNHDEFLKLVSNMKKNYWIRKITIITYGKKKTTNSSFELLIHTIDE
ncbi:hypothetical protein [Tenacibaculum finnmarkense]|uniref:hypothetical protein n=1 Tax=Tenacibaculum finnmarkense TaxID=2781243 RepID=UPI001E2E9F52|nr:hypothetical protein [Tenacibaculum finnmarkense]MCD8406202.1 hypothetical protein [Tenacibaculum dicentrarchi]MCD8413418.1 hypothetical protein [Tenacibaculum finnmarkense genomovar ulcerans]